MPANAKAGSVRPSRNSDACPSALMDRSLPTNAYGR